MKEKLGEDDEANVNDPEEANGAFGGAEVISFFGVSSRGGRTELKENAPGEGEGFWNPNKRSDD